MWERDVVRMAGWPPWPSLAVGSEVLELFGMDEGLYHSATLVGRQCLGDLQQLALEPAHRA